MNSPVMLMTGLPMAPFDQLFIVKADGTEVRFNDVVTGFAQYEEGDLMSSLVAAAESAVGAPVSIIFKPEV